MKKLKVRTEILIKAAIEVVSTYASDPENAPEWYANIQKAEWLKGTSAEEGAEIIFKARFLGREMVYTYRIVKWKPLSELVMTTAEGPFPMTTTYRWKETKGGTLMVLINQGEPKGFSRWVMPIMKLAMRKANEKDLKKIKNIIESTNNNH